MAHYGTIIKKRRMAVLLSQRGLGAEAGLSQSMISRIESSGDEVPPEKKKALYAALDRAAKSLPERRDAIIRHAVKTKLNDLEIRAMGLEEYVG